MSLFFYHNPEFVNLLMIDKNLELLIERLEGYVNLNSKEFEMLHDLRTDLSNIFGHLQNAETEIQNTFMTVHKAVSSTGDVYKMAGDFSGGWKGGEVFGPKNERFLKSLMTNRRKEHEKWAEELCEDVWASMFNGLGKMKNGGVKSLESCEGKTLVKLKDILRGRFVGKDLRSVEKAIEILIRELHEDVVVDVRNSYQELRNGFDGKLKPYLAIHVTLRIWGMPYELQLMTERASLITKLDHPVKRKGKVDLPEDLMKYLNALSWGAHYLDYKEYLAF